jgi:hypothetical protein
MLKLKYLEAPVIRFHLKGSWPPRVIYYPIILTTLSLACISRSFLLASTCICELTCFRVLVFPVRSLMYLAISSLRPAMGKKKQQSLMLLSSKRIFHVNSLSTNNCKGCTISHCYHNLNETAAWLALLLYIWDIWVHLSTWRQMCFSSVDSGKWNSTFGNNCFPIIPPFGAVCPVKLKNCC